jgi:hypothetical protein
MPRLALNLLVKNGESCLPRMLASVQGAIDELVVVDTGSIDRTREILDSFASGVGLARYSYHQLVPCCMDDLFFDDSPTEFVPSWEPSSSRLLADWSYARNVILDDTRADYVLKLDADDELRVPSHVLCEACGYLDNRLATRFISSYYDIFDGYGLHLERQAYVRLWRRNPESKWRQCCHEYLAGQTATNTEFHGPGLLVRDWRDSKGLEVRVPYRNLKVLERWRRQDPKIMDRDTGNGVMFRYTWATEAVPILSAEARAELFKLESLVHSSERRFQADISYQIGRTLEVEGQIDRAKERYELASRLVTSPYEARWHFPSLIQQFRMLDTAELRADNRATLDEVRTTLLQVAADVIPVGCNLPSYARITDRQLPNPR